MLLVQQIESLELPALAPYRSMKRQSDHVDQGIFVAEGEKVVRRLFESNLTVISALMPQKWLDQYEPMLKARPETIAAYVADKSVLESLTGFSMYQGVLALAHIPAAVPLATVLVKSPRPRFFAAVDALSNAENLGGLVRNGVAFGLQALLVGETSGSPYLRRAVRSSMGTVFHLPFVRATRLAESLRELRAQGVHCIAAHPHTDRKTIGQVDFTRDCCLVFGSEGYGLSAEVLATCDEAAAIPMHASVDSLNVGSAAAVFLYEARRQRGGMGVR